MIADNSAEERRCDAVSARACEDDEDVSNKQFSKVTLADSPVES